MSKAFRESLQCPGCGKPFEFLCYASVNATEDPKLKAALLRGELSTFRCPSCRLETNISYDLLYHDMRAKFFIWLRYPEEQGGSRPIDPRTDPMFKILQIQDDYQFRVVRSLNDLIEKIRLVDDGHDDLVIEVLKVLISMSDNLDLAHPLLYGKTGRSYLGTKSIVFVELLSSGARRHSHPLKPNYDNARQLADRLRSQIQRDADQGRWLRVSRDVVFSHMQAAGWIGRMG